MKKKLLSLLLALATLSSFSACTLDLSGLGEFLSGSPSTGESTGDSGSSDGGNSSGGGSTTDGHTYTAFTPTEKKMFEDYCGFVIPFAATDEYYVEEYEYYYNDTDQTEIGVSFYAYGLTQAEFTSYKAKFTAADGYTFDYDEKDDEGDTWYYYSKNGYYVDIAYYADDYGDYLVDVYVYELFDGDQTGGGGGTSSDVDLITNAGKGLPSGTNGVFNVDFTKATHVKDVTDQGYYLDGCPTTGKPAVLVIPVQFTDCMAISKGYTTATIKAAFEKGGNTDYFSVYDYYYTSSYGKLGLDITVLDTWFTPKYSSSYYEEATIDYNGEQVPGGDQLIMDEALAELSKTMDLSDFDSDGNNIIDAVVMVNTLDIDSDKDFNWAYRYWNLYTDDEGYYYEYDGVSANDYLWASYQFLHESYDASGNVQYDDASAMNTYTFIHEFGHVLGADDYYDTAYVGAPMDGCDIMDGMTGDHNAFTKFNYGWLTTSRLVVAENSVTLDLEDFSKNGDTIILANNWDETLGAYQEYYVLVYYKNVGLNGTVKGTDYGYFSRDGIVVYHVNASLYKEEIDGETYYDIYNNNTDVSEENGYGTEDNLIEYVKSASDTFTYVVGDRLPTNLKDDQGNSMAYSFTIDSITATKATITFTKNK